MQIWSGIGGIKRTVRFLSGRKIEDTYKRERVEFHMRSLFAYCLLLTALQYCFSVHFDAMSYEKGERL